VNTVLVGAVVVLAALLWGFRLLGYEVLVVQSGSMEPEYPVGSMVYVKPVDAEQLRTGDVITFTDMNGVTVRYEVVALDILQPTAVEEMTSGEFDLTLFTCTYGGKTRVTVRCDRIRNS